jgi:hypothetical protein
VTEPLDLKTELQILLRDAHMIKSALYLDTELAGSRTVTRQIGSLNALTEKMLDLYERVVGEVAPAPNQISKPALSPVPTKLDSDPQHVPMNFFKGKAVPQKSGGAPKGPRDSSAKPRKRGRPKKSQEDKVQDKIKDLKKPVGRPKKRGPNKTTRKVKGGRKGHCPPPNS